MKMLDLQITRLDFNHHPPLLPQMDTLKEGGDLPSRAHVGHTPILMKPPWLKIILDLVKVHGLLLQCPQWGLHPLREALDV